MPIPGRRRVTGGANGAVTRAITSSLVVAALLLAVGASGEAPRDLREAHGIFTGEIKPVLYVCDVEKSAPFYRDVFGFGFQGFANLDRKPYYAEMTAASVKFGLHEPTSPAQESKVGRQRLYFRVKDLRAQRSRVLAWGGEARTIKKTDWMDMVIVRDPDGNEIVFAVTGPESHSTNPWNTGQPATKGDDKQP